MGLRIFREDFVYRNLNLVQRKASFQLFSLLCEPVKNPFVFTFTTFNEKKYCV